MRHLVILTGASRGLGLAVARQLLAKADIHLLTLARKPSAALGPDAEGRFEQWAVDLADPVPVADRLEAWLARGQPAAYSRASLVNNAGVVTRPGPLADVDAAELSAAIRVGIEAPLLLAAAFLRATRDWSGADRRVLNISSGLGRRAMAGSVAYCAAKAGLDHASRALALEGVRAVSLAPGVIDTDMQTQLRAADPLAFPDRERFVQLRQGGHLDSPDAAASKLLAWLDRADFGREAVADVRE